MEEKREGLMEGKKQRLMERERGGDCCGEGKEKGEGMRNVGRADVLQSMEGISVKGGQGMNMYSLSDLILSSKQGGIMCIWGPL